MNQVRKLSFGAGILLLSLGLCGRWMVKGDIDCPEGIDSNRAPVNTQVVASTSTASSALGAVACPSRPSGIATQFRAPRATAKDAVEKGAGSITVELVSSVARNTPRYPNLAIPLIWGKV